MFSSLRFYFRFLFHQTFYGAAAFNQNIGSWDTSNVITMSSMFRDATAFNWDISAWSTSSATDMTNMFENAASFNQDIGAWDVSSVTNMYQVSNESMTCCFGVQAYCSDPSSSAVNRNPLSNLETLHS
jgi:surface protein